jgi:excisionase family DNA binding protein
VEKTIEPAVMSVDAGCTYVGIGRAHFYRLMDDGQIPSFHVGRRRLVRRADLDIFILKRLAAAGYEAGQG